MQHWNTGIGLRNEAMILWLRRCLQVGCCGPPTCIVAVAGGGGLGMGESLATFTVDMVTLVGVLLGAVCVCMYM